MKIVGIIDSMDRDVPQVRPLICEEYPQWDAFVAESPQGSIFSNSNYLKILAEASNSRLNIIGIFFHEILIGGCPLLEKRKPVLGVHAQSSGPGTPFCGLIFQDMDPINGQKNEIVYSACINALSDYVKRNYISISINNSPDLPDIRPFIRQGWDDRVSYAYYIDLENFSLNNFSSSVKKSIKIAKNKGLSYEKSCDIHSYYGLLTKVFQQHHASPPFNEIYYEKLLTLFQSTNSGDLRVVKDQSGQLLASYLWVWDSKRAYAWSGGAVTSPEFKDGGANKLIFYSFLEELQEMGLKEVNIMHANIPRLTLFATGFNPVLVSHYIVEYDCRLISCLRSIKKLF